MAADQFYIHDGIGYGRQTRDLCDIAKKPMAILEVVVLQAPKAFRG